jgi:hypothetical protein
MKNINENELKKYILKKLQESYFDEFEFDKEAMKAAMSDIESDSTAGEFEELGSSKFEKDPEFKKQVDDLENYTLDFVETQFYKNIQQGNTAEILFYLKTKGRKRGFIEKQEIDMTSKGESIVRQPRPIIIGGIVEDAE